MDSQIARDISLTLTRLVIGVVLAVHGYQKLFLSGPDKVAGGFKKMGVPQPELSAWATAIAEFGGGILLIVGLLCTIAAAVLTVVMLGATYFASVNGGFFIKNGGGEFAAVIVVGLIVLVVFGPGRVSLDRVIGNRKTLGKATE